MKTIWRRGVLVLLASGMLAACGGDEDPLIIDDEQDVQAGPDAGGEEDVFTIGDVGRPEDTEHRCGSAPITDWPLHDRVSTGSASSVRDGDWRVATIDGSGGGSMESRSNPFIYFDLESGEKVDITDVASLTSPAWDLGFKRIVIRTNGADSGPGGVTMAKVSNTTFESAQAPTVQAAWRDDKSFDGECEPVLDPIGNLVTAVNYLNLGNDTGSGSWYDYSSGGASGVGPVEGEIYFIDSPRSGKVYKIEIQSWVSGTYTLRWAEID